MLSAKNTLQPIATQAVTIPSGLRSTTLATITALLLSSVAVSHAHAQVRPVAGQTDLGNPTSWSGATVGETIEIGRSIPTDPVIGATKYFIDGKEVSARSLRMGNADLEIRNGGSLVLTHVIIAATDAENSNQTNFWGSSSSTIVVTGENSQLHSNATLGIGAFGPATVTVKDGGAITSSQRIEFAYARGDDTNPTYPKKAAVLIDNGRIVAGEDRDGTRNTNGIITINGPSTVDVINGGHIEATDILSVSSRPESDVEVTIYSGGTIKARELRVGAWGKGVLTIDGENSSGAAEIIKIGNNASAGHPLNPTSDGTVIVRNGGTLKAEADRIEIGNRGAKGRLVIGGLPGEAPEAPGRVESAVATLHTGEAEIVFNHNAQDFEFAASLAANDIPDASNPDVVPGSRAKVHVENGGTIFSGDVSGFAGQTSIMNDASLTLTNTALGGATTVSENGRLIFKAGKDIQQTGPIAGNGTIEQAGTGTLLLSGTVSASQLHASGSGEVTLTGNYSNVQNTQIDEQGSVAFGGSSNMTQGAIQNNGSLTINRDVETVYEGHISGTGAITHAGSQALTLNGTVEAGKLVANSSGELTVNGDSSKVATTEIGENSSLSFNGSAAITQGNIANNGALALNRESNTTLAGNITGPGNLTQSGAGDITLNGSIETSKLTANGTGALILNGNSSSLVATEIGEDGKLIFGGSAAVTQGNISNNGALAFDRTSEATLAGNITGLGNLTQSGAGDITLNGSIEASKLTANGTGALILNGNNSGVTTTEIDQNGSLTFGGSAALTTGTITNNGSLTFDRVTETTHAGDITGGGKVTHAGSQGLTLNGTIEASTLSATGTGTLTVNGNSSGVSATEVAENGSLTFGGSAAITQGTIANNGTLTFDRTQETTFSGSVSGAGKIEQTGAKLTLTGNSSAFTGTTAVAATSELLIEGSLGGEVVGNGKIVFNEKNRPEGQPVQQNANFTGSASINLGSNEQIINGSLAGHTGEVTSDNRVTLAGDQDVNSSSITVQSGLAIQASLTAKDQKRKINSSINAATGLDVFGSGIIEISDSVDGTQDIVGPVTVSEAELQINRTWTNTNVEVNNGGRLSGSGSVNNLNIGSGSRVSAGHDGIGQLSVAGNLTLQSGSVYDADVRPGTSESDQIIVTGSATIVEGAVLNVRPEGGQPLYDSVSNYNVLTAAGGLEGSFNLQGQTKGAFYELRQYTDANNVFLKAVKVRAFTDAATHPNHIGVAGAIESLVAEDAVWIALYNSLDDAAATRTLDLLSGDFHANVAGRVVEESFKSVDAARDRMFNAEDQGVWTQAYGSFREANNGQGLNSSTGGLLIGTDADIADGVRLGALVGYGQTHYSMDTRDASARSNDFTFGLYGNAEAEALKLRSGAIYTINEVSSTRNIVLPGLNEALTGEYRAGTLNAFGEVGYAIDLGSTVFEPFAGLSYVNISRGDFVENGGAAALSLSNGNVEALYANIGIRAEHDFTIGDGIQLKATGALTWRHALTDVTPSSTAAFSSGAGFTSAGSELAKDTFVVESGLSAALSDQANFGVTYTGQFGSSNTAHSVRAGLNVKF